jgi:hypothetical protein
VHKLVIEEGSMDYHQSIAATCEQTVAALSQTLSAHGYRLERSFDLHSARHAATADQYVVLLAYKQGASAPPVAITAHECTGVTRLQIEALPHSAAFTAALAEVTNYLGDCT